MRTKVAFSVDTQLLDELGKRLVSHDHIALAELVKNSYDADATFVSVEFDEKARAIRISDNGSGMTFDQVLNSWMRVATTGKLADAVSDKFGRPRTGSKGIGRFAVLRLSEVLELRASGRRKDGSIEQTNIVFDWRELHAGESLDALSFVAQREVLKRGTSGLELVLRGTTTRWTKTLINQLKKDLSDVVMAPAIERPGFDPDPGFEIRIQQGDGPSKPLGQEFLDAGWCRLTGRFDRGSSSWVLNLNAKFLDGVQTFRMPMPRSLLPARDSLRLEISWFPQKAAMWRERAIATQETVAAVLEETSGIRVFLNQNRVFPYGNKGDDWLRLEHIQASRITKIASPELEMLAVRLAGVDQRALLDSPRPQRLIGRVFITQGPAGPLVPTTDRMGFTENEAFLAFRELMQTSIQWMTIQYAAAKLRSSEERAEERDSNRVRWDASKLAHLLKQTFSGSQPVSISPAEGRQIVDAALTAERAFQRERTRLEMLEHLASASTIVFAFAHEVAATIRILEQAIEELPSNTDSNSRRQFDEAAVSMRDLLGLVSTIASDARSKEHEPQPVEAVVERCIRTFASVAARYEIRIDHKVEPHLVTPPLHAAALMSILLNLLSNSIKACLADGTRKVRVTAARSGNALRIAVLDSGIGLPAHFRETAFEPMVRDPAGNLYSKLARYRSDGGLSTLSQGMGLGLSIVRSVVERAGGRVSFVDSPSPWSTCVEVVIPYEQSKA